MKIERRNADRQDFDSWCMGMEINNQGRCNFVSFRGIDISETGIAVSSTKEFDKGQQFIVRLPFSWGEQLVQATVMRTWSENDQNCLGLQFASMNPTEESTNSPANSTAA